MGMSYEHMNTAGFLVTLRLPDEIQPEQAIRELQTCITFGHAEVVLQYVIPDPIPGQDGAQEPSPNELASGFSTDGPTLPPMRS
jgi:hypothetical protein